MAGNYEGYEGLRAVLNEALDRAAIGKGAERHGNSRPFEEQWIVQGGLEYGEGALFFQLRKKLAEHKRLGADAGDRELLDVINYAAAAIIVRRKQRAETPVETLTQMLTFVPNLGAQGVAR